MRLKRKFGLLFQHISWWLLYKKEYVIKLSLNTILQIFSVSIFEKVSIYQLLNDTEEKDNIDGFDNTLNLINL